MLELFTRFTGVMCTMTRRTFKFRAMWNGVAVLPSKAISPPVQTTLLLLLTSLLASRESNHGVINEISNKLLDILSSPVSTSLAGFSI